MLVYDHNERITAKDALQHKYFDTVRGTQVGREEEKKQEE